jgi:hypothetical protein
MVTATAEVDTAHISTNLVETICLRSMPPANLMAKVLLLLKSLLL